MKRVKEALKNRILIFILGGIIFSAVSVYAVTYFPSNQVTYDNKTSDLSSTNVQNALDELYQTCQSCSSKILGDYIYFTSDGVNGGGGETFQLYKVPIEGGKVKQPITINNSNAKPYYVGHFTFN